MDTRNALQRQPAEGYQPPRNRKERRAAQAQFAKRVREAEKRRKRKQAIKEAAGSALIGILFGGFLAWMILFAPDPEAEYRNQQVIEMSQELRMIPAINSDHAIPADEYEQYLADRETQLKEAGEWTAKEEAAHQSAYQNYIDVTGGGY